MSTGHKRGAREAGCSEEAQVPRRIVIAINGLRFSP